MTIFSRMKYAMYALIAATMIVMLTLGIAEAAGVLRGFDIQSLMFNPFYLVSVFVVGLVIAPALSKRLPVSGDPPEGEQNGKPTLNYTARTLLIVVVGLLLAVLVNLVVSLVGRFG